MLMKNNLIIKKFILKYWEGAASSLAHTGLRLSQVTRNEKLD